MDVNINDLPEELSSQVCLFAEDHTVNLTVGGSDDGTVQTVQINRPQQTVSVGETV